MLLVIIGHIPLGEVGWGELTRVLYAFHMPLFFMISGMAYHMSNRALPAVIFIKRKVITLVVPYFLWQFALIPYWYLYIRILLGRDISVWEPIKGIFYGNYAKYSIPSNAMWFLLALFWVSIAVYFLEKIRKQSIQNSIVFILAGTAWLAPKYSTIELPWQLTAVPVAIVFYWLGFLFMKHLQKITGVFNRVCNSEDHCVVFILLCITVSSYIIDQNTSVSMGRATYGIPIYFYSAAILMSVVCICIAMWLPKIRMLTFIGMNTLTFVAIHCPILRLMQNLSPISGRFTAEHPFMATVMIVLVCVPVCILVNKKIPILNGKFSYKNGERKHEPEK